MDRGAKAALVGATHPVFVGLAMQRLVEAPISRVVVTNTIPGGDRFEPLKDKIVQLCVGPLLGDAIHRIHHNLSVSALFRRGVGVKR